MHRGQLVNGQCQMKKRSHCGNVYGFVNLQADTTEIQSNETKIVAVDFICGSDFFVYLQSRESASARLGRGDCGNGC